MNIKLPAIIRADDVNEYKTNQSKDFVWMKSLVAYPKERYEQQPDGSLKLREAGSPITQGEQPEKTYNREQYLEILKKWLYLEDLQAIDIILATALCIYLSGDPLWMFIITAAGGTKTELLRSFRGERIYTISTLTPQTLISGLKGNNNTDLLPKLNGKLLVIKDFTSILSKKSEDQTAIFADLREAYDGYLEKSFGSGVGTKRYDSTFGIIAGVTPAVDMYRIVHSLLGERFLKCRLRTNAKAAISRAGDLVGQEHEMRKELMKATTGCLAHYAKRIEGQEPISPDSTARQRIKALADITAKLRSEVARDRFHKVLYEPSPEIGTRLAKQLLKLGEAVATLYERNCIREQEYEVLLRVAADSIPSQRMLLINALMGAEPMSTKEAGDKAKIPTDTAKEFLEDLWMLKLVLRSGDNTFAWQLTEETNTLLIESGLGTQTTLCKHKKQ